MITSRPAPGRGRFLALDALRGFAAIAVALFHFNHQSVVRGYLAVDFFFALSGFVLVSIYTDRFEVGLTPWRFVRMRIARLYPLYAVGIAIGMVAALQSLMRQRAGHMGVGEFIGAAVLNPLMLPNPFGPRMFPFNGPAWSLFFELVANVAMAFLLIKLRLRALLILVFLAAIALLVTVIIAPGIDRWPDSAGSALNGGAYWDSFQVGLVRTFFSFSVGMAIAKLPQSHVRAQRVWALPFCILLITLMAVPIPPAERLACDLAVVCVASPLILYACSRFEPDRLFAPTANFVGEISFALYAVHYQMLALFFFIENKTHFSRMALTPFFLASSILLAWALVRWFDIPARRYLARLIVR